MGTDKRNHVKILAAVIGGSAVVAMGALAMTIHEQVAPDAAKSTTMTVRRDHHDAVVGRGHTDGKADIEGPGTLALRRTRAALTGSVRLSFHR